MYTGYCILLIGIGTYLIGVLSTEFNVLHIYKPVPAAFVLQGMTNIFVVLLDWPAGGLAASHHDQSWHHESQSHEAPYDPYHQGAPNPPSIQKPARSIVDRSLQGLRNYLD